MSLESISEEGGDNYLQKVIAIVIISMIAPYKFRRRGVVVPVPRM
jgi:hypothetical protein